MAPRAPSTYCGSAILTALSKLSRKVLLKSRALSRLERQLVTLPQLLAEGAAPEGGGADAEGEASGKAAAEGSAAEADGGADGVSGRNAQRAAAREGAPPRLVATVGVKEYRSAALHLIGNDPGTRVLEIGCHLGTSTALLHAALQSALRASASSSVADGTAGGTMTDAGGTDGRTVGVDTGGTDGQTATGIAGMPASGAAGTPTNGAGRTVGQTTNGAGHTVGQTSNGAGRTVGVDVSASIIRRARALHPAVTFAVADAWDGPALRRAWHGDETAGSVSAVASGEPTAKLQLGRDATGMDAVGMEQGASSGEGGGGGGGGGVVAGPSIILLDVGGLSSSHGELDTLSLLQA